MHMNIRLSLLTAALVIAMLCATTLNSSPAFAAFGGPDLGASQHAGGSADIDTHAHDGNGLREGGYNGHVEHRTFMPDNAPPSSFPVSFVDCGGGPGAPIATGFFESPQSNLHYTVQLVQTLPNDDPAFAVCRTPGLGAPPSNAVAAATAIAWARDYFNRLPLPQPQPTMSSPQGITGATHSLDLAFAPEIVFDSGATPFGTMSMHVYAKTNVNWGDGTHGTYTSSGGPYPQSPITHTWTKSNRYDIAATSAWTAEWTMGPYNGAYFRGVFTGISTNGTLRAWPVVEAQASLAR
jgi:hypothetical protein